MAGCQHGGELLSKQKARGERGVAVVGGTEMEGYACSARVLAGFLRPYEAREGWERLLLL